MHPLDDRLPSLLSQLHLRPSFTTFEPTPITITKENFKADLELPIWSCSPRPLLVPQRHKPPENMIGWLTTPQSTPHQINHQINYQINLKSTSTRPYWIGTIRTSTAALLFRFFLLRHYPSLPHTSTLPNFRFLRTVWENIKVIFGQRDLLSSAWGRWDGLRIFGQRDLLSSAWGRWDGLQIMDYGFLGSEIYSVQHEVDEMDYRIGTIIISSHKRKNCQCWENDYST